MIDKALKLATLLIILFALWVGISVVISTGSNGPDKVIEQTLKDVDQEMDLRFKKTIETWGNHGR